MSWPAKTLVLAILVGITTQQPHYCGREMVDRPRCLNNQKEVCKECPECLQGIAWGTWHKAGTACKCDGLCYEGRPYWFTWADQESARSKDYADHFAGAGPANPNYDNLMMPMPVPGHPSVKPELVYLGGDTRSPRINLESRRILSPGNPRMTNLHSNRRQVIPRIPGQSSQTAHVGMMRPRMGMSNPNIKPNRMINMHSRKMNPNLDYNSAMMSSGQEAELTKGGCWGCAAGLVLAAAGCWPSIDVPPVFITCVAAVEEVAGCDMGACVCPWICGSEKYSRACNACHEFSGETTAAPAPAPAPAPALT